MEHHSDLITTRKADLRAQARALLGQAGPERTAALEEIAAKYLADFPQTRVEIVTVEDSQEALAMLEGQQELDASSSASSSSSSAAN